MKSPGRFTREETKGQKGEGKMGNEREGVSYDTYAVRNENKWESRVREEVCENSA